MPDVSDMDLMQEFADHHSESAFTELVQRHINLVYSVALRYVGNSQDAQDVTQAVFIILAKKITSLRQRTTLTGWLYETTRFASSQLLRSRKRQQARDIEAFMQSTLNEPEAESVWRLLAPHLEGAMSDLGERDRTLLVLRFYESKSGAEAAALLGIRVDAAQKRTARALEKLRKFLTKRGVTLTAAAIAGVVSANSVQAAPVGLAKSISAVAIAKGVAASGSTLTLVKGALKTMAWTKMKTAVVVGIGVLLAAGTTTVIICNQAKPLQGIPKDWSVLSGGVDQWNWTNGAINGHSLTGDTVLASSKQYGNASLSAIASTTNRDACFAIRMQDADNGYFVVYAPDGTLWASENGSDLALVKRTSGNEVTLAIFRRQGLSQSAKISVTAKGSRIEVRLNDVPVLKANDTTFASGFLGLRVYGDSTKPCDATFSNVTID